MKTKNFIKNLDLINPCNFKLVHTYNLKKISYLLKYVEINKGKKRDIDDFHFQIEAIKYNKIVILSEFSLKRLNSDYFLDFQAFIENWYSKKYSSKNFIIMN